jgi:adenine deaminase
VPQPSALHRRDEAGALVAVARGKVPADLVVRGGILANVYTGELLEDWGVAIVGPRIAAIGPDVDRCIGPSTTVIEANGQVIAPGFFDGHAHLDCIHRLDLYLAAAIPTGLTTLITETSFLSSVGGHAAVASFVAHLPHLPITVLATAPTISYLCSDRGDGQPMISTEEMARLLEEPAVVGLGECYWPAVVEGGADLHLLITKAEALGKRAEGHTAGARGNKLAACVAAGIGSCHEPIAPDEVVERLRLGLYTMVRDGSVRRDLSALNGVLKGISPRRLILASDTVWAHHLLERGYLDEAARQAVAAGLEPMQALQAITLTPAEHFRIESLVGGLAPGRQADLVLIPDFPRFRPSLVMARGQVVARNGRATVAIPPLILREEVFPRPRVARPLSLEHLRVPAPSGRERVRIRVIQFTGEIVTQASVREVEIRKGALTADPEADLLKVVAMDRRGNGQIAHGFVSGFGMRRGGLAVSTSFDVADLILLGASDADMLLAGERMLAQGGGLVVACNGAIRTEVPFPLGGITSDQPMPVLARQIEEFQGTLRDLGCVRENPFLSAQVLTFTAIPALRIRERGLWDVRGNQVVSLIVDDGEA